MVFKFLKFDLVVGLNSKGLNIKLRMGDFRNLEVWQECRKFRSSVRLVAKSFPDDERFILTSQLMRSVSSVTANIAEGYGRFHPKESIQFTRIAKGSLTETLDHLTVALDEGYIDENQFNALLGHYETCIKLLNGYINYLIKKQRSS